MLVNTLSEIKNILHAQFCYHFFITPLPLPVDKEYREFARRACEYVNEKRTEIMHRALPRHHVIHYFSQRNSPTAKKVLITHGWMSRAAYMVRLIRALHQEGYEVYAMDFPAHGEARGWQLPWYDAVHILHNTLSELGPFHAVIGHSFGGAMLLNTLNLSHQLPEWKLEQPIERGVMIAAPTCMRSPVSRVARRFKLSGEGLQHLRDCFKQSAQPDINYLNYRRMAKGCNTPILCIHGTGDKTIKPAESAAFCQEYPHGSLVLLPNVDHIGVLVDERVENHVLQFLS